VKPSDLTPLVEAGEDDVEHERQKGMLAEIVNRYCRVGMRHQLDTEIVDQLNENRD